MRETTAAFGYEYPTPTVRRFGRDFRTGPLLEPQRILRGCPSRTHYNKYLRRAGLDYWECFTVQYHESLQALHHTVISGRFFYVSIKASQLYTQVRYSHDDYLVFGSETRGLPRELIEEHPETAIRVPMWGAKPRSHNLSNAAAIVV